MNCIKATEYAIDRLHTLPLCNRRIKETHAVLMENIRGQGSTFHNARYISPCPEDMEAAMSDLEKYINSEDKLNFLIRAALIHYQFETIHPFLDGNGRMGAFSLHFFSWRMKLGTKEIMSNGSDFS